MISQFNMGRAMLNILDLSTLLYYFLFAKCIPEYYLFDETHDQSFYFLIVMIIMMLHRGLVVGRNEI
jgi:hypothetical protein